MARRFPPVASRGECLRLPDTAPAGEFGRLPVANRRSSRLAIGAAWQRGALLGRSADWQSAVSQIVVQSVLPVLKSALFSRLFAPLGGQKSFPFSRLQRLAARRKIF